MALQIRKAERRKVPIKIAITGPSGSGKTYSSLRLAYGLCGENARVLLIDTENGSGELYAGAFPEYDVCPIEAPYTTEKYEEAIRLGVQHKYDVVVIDSLSHAWAGSGGLLEQKEAMDKHGGNKFANWGAITQRHESLKAFILESPIHVIATMRSKQEYVQDEQTKKVTKLGMAPIQRDGMDYEFTIVFDVAHDHTAVASKDRTSLFPSLTGKLTEKNGEQIRQWLDGATAAPVAPQPRAEQSAPTARPAPPTERAPMPANNGFGSAVKGSERGAFGQSTGAARPTAPEATGKCPDCHAPEGKTHTRNCPHFSALPL